MRQFFILLTTAMTILSATAAPPAPEDAKLAAFFDRYLEERFRRHPVDATNAGDHRYDDRLDDLSAAARAADVEFSRATLESLPREVEYSKLTRTAQIDFEILRHHLDRVLWLAANTKP